MQTNVYSITLILQQETAVPEQRRKLLSNGLKRKGVYVEIREINNSLINKVEHTN
jgi:hypothetical protein